jgi:hypothetical protein
MPALEAFLGQTGEDKAELQATYATLAGILDMTGDGEVSSSDGSEG